MNGIVTGTIFDDKSHDVLGENKRNILSRFRNSLRVPGFYYLIYIKLQVEPVRKNVSNDASSYQINVQLERLNLRGEFHF